MKRLIHISAACLLAAATFSAAPSSAQETNTTQRSFLTFSGPVELPGVTLPAGTYEFRLANEDTSRNVVQAFTKEGREPVGQWTFAQAERAQASDETVIMFRESREGMTPAVQYWYFPGERIGKEFIYPKDQAERISARTGQAVRSSDGPVKAEASASAEAPAAAPAAAPAPAIAEAGEPVAAPASPTRSPQSEQAQAAASIANPEPSLEARAEVSPNVEPAPRPVGTTGAAAAEPQPAGTSGQVEAEPARELPATASPLPLAALIGLLSLAGAAGIRAIRS